MATQKLDAVSVAASLQLQEQKREYMYSLITLVMKIGLLSILSASLVKLGFSSHQRLRRHMELISALELESQKLDQLNLRFDRLFTIGGEMRLMDDQDQWIAPNSVRVIWH